MRNYSSLVEHFKKINHFSHLMSICHWDQATMMPSGGSKARSQAIADLSLFIHQLSTDKTLIDKFNDAEQEALDKEQQASLKEMKRDWLLSTTLPESLVKEKSLAANHCEHHWREQRQQNDWQGFCSNFSHVVELSQQEAKIRAEKLGGSPYEALLDIYEPGMSCKNLDALFADLTSWLPDLMQQVQEKQAHHSFISPQGPYPISQQEKLGRVIMKQLGFDFNHGRLDVSAHPFCGGVSTDVRITTRYNENDFVGSLLGIIHETGHACYEQGLPCHLSELPVGHARSMGVHESQSLFFEMQLGRSTAFIKQISPLLALHFPNNDQKIFHPSNLQKLYRQVKPGLIRVDADELTYPFHVILRYEIERDLINKKISYQDIPALWDEKMHCYLGLNTQGNFKDGCMQDIHWSDGSFGYFPSYTLGAMYAAQLMAAMRKTVDVDSCLSQFELAPIRLWLSEHIWSKARLFSTDELIKQATGETLNPVYFKRHLEQRYLK